MIKKHEIQTWLNLDSQYGEYKHGEKYGKHDECMGLQVLN
jgi:hypothetical protein